MPWALCRPQGWKYALSIFIVVLNSLQVSVKPAHVAVFSVEVTVPKKEGLYSGEFEITTNFEVSKYLLTSLFPVAYVGLNSLDKTADVIIKAQISLTNILDAFKSLQVLHVPIYFKAMDGKVFPSPAVITFEPCFPVSIARFSGL
jgi:hypothetical protein